MHNIHIQTRRYFRYPYNLSPIYFSLVLFIYFHVNALYADAAISQTTSPVRSFEAENHFGFSRETHLQSSELNNQGGSHICLDLWSIPKHLESFRFGIRTIGSGVLNTSHQLNRISTGLVSSLDMNPWWNLDFRMLGFLGISSQTIHIKNKSTSHAKAITFGAGWEKSKSLIQNKLDLTWGVMLYLHDWNQTNSPENLEASIQTIPSKVQYRSFTQSLQIGLLFKL